MRSFPHSARRETVGLHSCTQCNHSLHCEGKAVQCNHSLHCEGKAVLEHSRSRKMLGCQSVRNQERYFMNNLELLIFSQPQPAKHTNTARQRDHSKFRVLFCTTLTKNRTRKGRGKLHA
uniref:Uncharacterized protein n=1 Tax=Anguilla anguilla TaxID=7936 RepID=A0A0E9WQM6_ANGAN